MHAVRHVYIWPNGSSRQSAESLHNTGREVSSRADTEAYHSVCLLINLVQHTSPDCFLITQVTQDLGLTSLLACLRSLWQTSRQCAQTSTNTDSDTMVRGCALILDRCIKINIWQQGFAAESNTASTKQASCMRSTACTFYLPVCRTD